MHHKLEKLKALQHAHKGVQTATGFLPYGDHMGIVDLVTVVPTGEQPAIYVRLAITDDLLGNRPTVTHITRFHNEVSRRIGIGEIRAAFPQCLLTLNDKDVVKYLLQHTSEFVGCPVHFSVHPQMDKQTKMAMRDKDGNEYFNVRLTSAIRDIQDETSAKNMVDAMFDMAGSSAVMPTDWKVE